MQGKYILSFYRNSVVKKQKNILYLSMSHKKHHHFRIFVVIALTLASFSVGILAGYFLFTTPLEVTNPRIAPSATQTLPPPPKEVTFIAVGDIMLSRNVARHAEKSGKAGWIWDNIRSFLYSSDFVIGNLE